MIRFQRLASRAPLLIGCAFVVVLLVCWNSIITSLWWDGDAAAAPLIAEQFGRAGTGVISIGHFGWYSMLWLMRATRDLPEHRDLWAVLPYALLVAVLSALALVVRHVRGTWAGATFFAMSIAVGPLALRDLTSPNFHTTTVINVALLGAALPLLGSDPRGYARRAAVALPIALLTGLDVASDPLLWVAGVVPFIAAIAYGAIRCRSARVAMVVTAAAMVSTIVVVDKLVRSAMNARDVVTIAAPIEFTSVSRRHGTVAHHDPHRSHRPLHLTWRHHTAD